MIYATNVSDEDLATGTAMADKLRDVAEKKGAKLAIVSAKSKVKWSILAPKIAATFSNCFESP
jgi:ribosome-binding ATPase YchF (GTP1/OBG family)